MFVDFLLSQDKVALPARRSGRQARLPERARPESLLCGASLAMRLRFYFMLSNEVSPCLPTGAQRLRAPERSGGARWGKPSAFSPLRVLSNYIPPYPRTPSHSHIDLL
jgi:hypothetical protein